MKSIIKKGGWLFVFLCILLVMNHRFGYITLLGIFIIFVFANSIWSKSKMDTKGWLLVLYCFFYIVASATNGFSYSLSTLVLYLVAPPIFYYYGMRITNFCDNEKNLLSVWFWIILCYAIDAIVVGLDGMLVSGELIASERVLSFYEDQATSATVVGLPLNIGMVGLSIAAVISERRLKLLYLLLALSSVLVVTYLMNRTGWVILFACLCALIFMKGIGNRRFLIISILLLVVGGWMLLSFTDIISSEVVQSYIERNEVEGLEARSDRWSANLENLIIYPFGWAEKGEIYYVHNMWLDIARISGLLPFLLLSGLSLYFFITSFRKALKYRTDDWYLMFGLNLCFFASCFVEPIFGGTHFMLYCMLWGSQSALERRIGVKSMRAK